MEYNDLPVLTTKRLAKLYKTFPSLIELNYLKNQDEFEEGEHFFKLSDEKLETFGEKYPEEICECKKEVYLWTEEGMYLHAQHLTGVIAWRAYCQFIYYNFKQSEELKQAIEILEKASFQLEREQILYELAKELV